MLCKVSLMLKEQLPIAGNEVDESNGVNQESTFVARKPKQIAKRL